MQSPRLEPHLRVKIHRVFLGLVLRMLFEASFFRLTFDGCYTVLNFLVISTAYTDHPLGTKIAKDIGRNKGKWHFLLGCPMPFGPVRPPAYPSHWLRQRAPPIHEDMGVYAARRAQGTPQYAWIPSGAKPSPFAPESQFSALPGAPRPVFAPAIPR